MEMDGLDSTLSNDVLLSLNSYSISKQFIILL